MSDGQPSFSGTSGRMSDTGLNPTFVTSSEFFWMLMYDFSINFLHLHLETLHYNLFFFYKKFFFSKLFFISISLVLIQYIKIYFQIFIIIIKN